MQPESPKSQPEQSQEDGFYRPTQEATYTGDSRATATPTQPTLPNADITWEASEYVHQDKGGSWIVGLVVFGLVLFALALFLGAWTFAILAIVMTVTIGIYGFRKPSILKYHLSVDGLTINGHTYHFDEFRAFGVLSDGAFFSVQLIPTKRFMPAISVYFAEEQGEKIVDILSSYLPMQEIKPDPFDTFMRRLHF